MSFVHYDIFCLVCVSCRVVLGFLVTSSPLGLISSTTRGVMTVTTIWRGASCLRTSKPGNPLNAVHKTGMWKKVERSKFNGCLSIVSPVWLLTATSGGAKAAASVPTSEETTVTTSLLLQRSSAITEFTVTPADLWHCFYICIFLHSLSCNRGTWGWKPSSTQYIYFSTLSREELTDFSLCQYMKAH